MKPYVVYTPDYDIHFGGLEKLHPFDTRKYSRAYEEARKRLGAALAQATLIPPGQVSDDDLRLVHTREYLESLKSVQVLVQALEFPPLALFPYGMIEQHLLRPMRLATMGTLMAARAALHHRLLLNLSGGYHHASASKGEGFTIFSDIALAIIKLRREGLLAEHDGVLIIDLDAHQGNGYARIFRDDATITIFDMYNGSIYPMDGYARKRINYDLPLPPGCADQQYLLTLKAELPRALEAAQAKLAFYVAGTDIYERDMLGGLRVTEEAIFDRDSYVLNRLAEADIPFVMLPAGGYSADSYRFIARTLCYLFERWGG
ncbi:MAG: histone deacetylase [Chloroflexi bacterium]|nr:histone deacetylase [Chloroflexota bacterium]